MNAPASSVIAGTVQLLTGASVCWVGCHPEPRQRVYFGNHTSHVDSLLVWSALPPAIRILTRPVGAGDYWGGPNPARRLLTRFFGAVLIATMVFFPHGVVPTLGGWWKRRQR